MSLSKSALGKIGATNILVLDGTIIQETNIASNSPLTTTAYIIIDEPTRMPPRENASLSEILSFLNIL